MSHLRLSLIMNFILSMKYFKDVTMQDIFMIDIAKIREALLKDKDFLRGIVIEIAREREFQDLILRAIIPRVATKDDLKELETRLVHYIDKRVDDLNRRIDDLRKFMGIGFTILAVLLSALIGVSLM